MTKIFIGTRKNTTMAYRNAAIPFFNVAYGLPPQPDATQALNLSAGVSNS
jgi:hypothetical protein